MQKKIRAIRLSLLEGRLGEVAYQITKVHFSAFHRPVTTWQPRVNIFECGHKIRICAELAGIDTEQVELQIGAGHLILRGERPAAEPNESYPNALDRRSVRVLSMEIDYGPFERQIPLPADADIERLKTSWQDGLLWIELPRRHHA